MKFSCSCTFVFHLERRTTCHSPDMFSSGNNSSLWSDIAAKQKTITVNSRFIKDFKGTKTCVNFNPVMLSSNSMEKELVKGTQISSDDPYSLPPDSVTESPRQHVFKTPIQVGQVKQILKNNYFHVCVCSFKI